MFTSLVLMTLAAANGLRVPAWLRVLWAAACMIKCTAALCGKKE